jgi:hypothetical protein
VLAFAVAPAVAALVFSFLQPAYAGLPSLADRIYKTFLNVALVGAYPSAIIIGLPAFFILRSRQERPTAWFCALTGAWVASLPLVPFFGLTIPMAEIAAAGALGGLVFWVVAAAGSPQLTATAPPAASPT